MRIDVLVDYAHTNLTGDRELEALWSRGVTDQQIQEFRIGYIGTLPALDLGKDFLNWWNGSKLRDVYVFPLTNSLGQVKGLQFRHVEREAKGYTDYFIAKDEPAFFGFAQAMPHVWATQTICLVEGPYDLLPTQRVIPFAVPTMTAGVSSAFFRFLLRNVKEVWFGYDFDRTGREAVKKFQEEYGKEFRVKAPQFPRIRLANSRAAKDLSDMWEALGDERFGVHVRSAFEMR